MALEFRQNKWRRGRQLIIHFYLLYVMMQNQNNGRPSPGAMKSYSVFQRQLFHLAVSLKTSKLSFSYAHKQILKIHI